MMLYKAFLKASALIFGRVNKAVTIFRFKGNGVHFADFRTNGIPYVMVSRGGKMSIGRHFAMNNGVKGNPIGCYEKCTFFVGPKGSLTIGDNVGISQTALISR